MIVVRYVAIIFGLFVFGAACLSAQTPVSLQNNDQPCDLSIDGRALGTFAASASKNIALQPGSHFFVCMNSSIAKAKDKREVLLESSVTLQISGASPVVVQLPRLTVEAKNTSGAPVKVTASADLMTDQCRPSSTRGEALTDVVSIVDGSIRSCNGVGSYLLVRSHRRNYLVPMQQVKLFVSGSDSAGQDTLFEIRADQ